MAYDLIKISGLPLVTPDSGQDIVVGVGDYAKRINYNAVKADMVGTSPSYTTDTEPYLMRQTEHVGVVGKCALNKLIGGSLGWNQILSQSGLSNGTVGGITLVKNSNGSVTLTGARTGENVNFNVDYVANTIKYQTGHVYYLPWSGKNGIGLQIIMESDVGADSLNKNRLIKVAAAASTRSWARIRIGTPMNEDIGTVTYFPQILDITQMFGATIADYAANLENTYGTGIAWLSRYIDLGTYHAYDAGSIQSVQAMAHVTTGKNLIDQTQFVQGSITGSGVDTAVTIRLRSPFVKVLPNTQYSLSVNSEVLLFEVHQYDANKNWLGYLAVNATSYTFTTRSDVEYFKLLIRYSNNATIVVSALTALQMEFGSTATAYEPYTAHTYPLGSDTLRGYPMLVNNKLAFDGDEKYPNGTTKRKYGIVDLGTLPWTKYNVAEGTLFRASIDTIKRTNAPTDVPNIICSHYPVKAQSERAEKTISQPTNNSAVDIIDSAYTDATAFKTAMSGVYLVYPLETPTTESSTSYQKVQTIDADGTESFTVSSPVPVGHETQTPDNVLAALEWLGE